jgi:lipoprotein-releasing system permease protein
MSPNLQIALRFIFSRKRSMLMSLAGIIFGVGFFIVTQAQTSGFQAFYIQTIIGTNSALRIEDRLQATYENLATGSKDNPAAFLTQAEGFRKYVQGIEYPNKLREAVADFNQVTAISEVVQGSARAVSVHNQRSADIHGIRLDDHLAVTDLETKVQLGDLNKFRFNQQSVLLGSKLAQRMRVVPGDYIVLETPAADNRRYLVAATFETGISQIDKVRIFMHLNEARSLMHKPFGESIFQIAIQDNDQAIHLAAHMEAVLGHNVMSWQEREKTWLEVFKVLRISSAITVSSIILISGLGMFNTLAMIAMEKTREIAILRSMGYTRQDISRIFLWQGSAVLAVGTVLGWAMGAGVTLVITQLPIRIRGIFSTDHFIVNWDIAHYGWATVIALIVVMLASYFPSKKAAQLEPGDIIRGTAG